MTKQHKAGFTLIELSIVLVIIGLIVGGVLVGRDLIEAAELRKTGSLIEKLNTAVNTFRAKYNCLPGDCPYASQLFSGATDGNGDGFITSSAPPPYGGSNDGPENFDFFQHLISAALIPDTRGCGSNCVVGNVNYCTSTFGYISPISPVSSYTISCGRSTNIALIYSGYVGINGCFIHPCYSPFSTHSYVFSSRSDGGDSSINLSPAIMAQLDTKFDDGWPMTGSIRAWALESDLILDDTYTSHPLLCMNRSTTPYSYNVSDTNTDCPTMWAAPF